MVIVCADETKDYDNIIPSKAANTILDMAGIEAVFVLTKISKAMWQFLREVTAKSMFNGLWKKWAEAVTLI